jgi:hypothetical protein
VNPLELAKIISGVKALCPAQKWEEATPDMWELVLGELNYADAKAAIVSLGRHQTFIAPGEVFTEVKRIRADRVGRAPMPCPNDVPGVSAGDEIRAIQRAMADGRITNLAEAYAYERWGGSLHLAYQRDQVPALEGSEPVGDPDRVRKAIAPAFGRVPRAQ